jgi:hypothetical protein
MGGLRGEGEVENENEVENEGEGETVIKRGAAPQLFVVRSSEYICIRPVEDCGIPSEAARRKLG